MKVRGYCIYYHTLTYGVTLYIDRDRRTKTFAIAVGHKQFFLMLSRPVSMD